MGRVKGEVVVRLEEKEKRVRMEGGGDGGCEW